MAAMIAVEVPSEALLDAEYQEFLELEPAEQLEELRTFVAMVDNGNCEAHPFYDYLTSGLFVPLHPYVAGSLDATIAASTGVTPDVAARQLVEACGDLEVAVELCRTLGYAKGKMH